MRDLIDRNEVLETISNLTTSMSVCLSKGESKGMKRMQDLALVMIKDIPNSLQTGKWIVKENRGFIFRSIYLVCPFCRDTLDPSGLNAGRGDANFCPNCGAELEMD